MTDWPSELIEDLARRRCVVVIGSGVSRHSKGRGDKRPPTWKKFLQEALDSCPGDDKQNIQYAIDTGDFLHACEWIKNRFDESWNEYLRSVFQLPRYKPKEIHSTIFRLDARVVFSLNFDDIYERFAQTESEGSHIVKSYRDRDVEEFLRGSGRYVIKVHGSLHSPESLIFTQREYARARREHSAFYQAFDACLLTHTFLFIGAGYNDPDVALLLENQNFSFPTSRPHYFLSSAGIHRDLSGSLRRNRNLKVLEYEKKDEYHSGLVECLTTLVGEVDQMREELKRTGNW